MGTASAGLASTSNRGGRRRDRVERAWVSFALLLRLSRRGKSKEGERGRVERKRETRLMFFSFTSIFPAFLSFLFSLISLLSSPFEPLFIIRKKSTRRSKRRRRVRFDGHGKTTKNVLKLFSFLFFMKVFLSPFSQSLLREMFDHTLTCGSALLPRVTVASIVPWGSEVAT